MFWLTKGTFTELYPESVNYEHFSLEHLLFLAIYVVIIVIAMICYKRLDEKGRDKFLKIMAVALIIDELWKHIGCLATGQWNFEYLPLHLCSINVFFCVLYAFKRSDTVAELLYATCLPGAAVALIMPTWNAMPYWNFMTIHSTTVHILLVLFPLVLIAGGFKPNFRRIPKVLLIVLCECLPIYFLNKVLNTNFFFINGTEENPLLELLAGIFGENLYVIGVVLIFLVLWVFMYFPWLLAERKNAKKL